jgi:predicted GNAT family N-acyltransferase
MKFTEILYGSELYAKELDLRNVVLRIPLGLSLYEEDLSGERGSRHFGILEGSSLLACAVLEPNGEGSVTLRQMAVSERARGLGVGSGLVGELERLAKGEGICEVVLSARVSAAGFYESLGYVRFGDEFLSVTIPHIKMRKNI